GGWVSLLAQPRIRSGKHSLGTDPSRCDLDSTGRRTHYPTPLQSASSRRILMRRVLSAACAVTAIAGCLASRAFADDPPKPEARATLWSRLSPAIDAMIQNVAIQTSGSVLSPKGEGAFRDEAAGFACRFPSGYGVRVSAREFERVEFAPAGDGPVIAVFRMESDKDAEAEAADLVTYYKGDEVGGEAETAPIGVAGMHGVDVEAQV